MIIYKRNFDEDRHFFNKKKKKMFSLNTGRFWKMLGISSKRYLIVNLHIVKDICKLKARDKKKAFNVFMHH